MTTELTPNFIFEEEGHRYLLDGVEIPSVTTVIGAVLGPSSECYTEESRMRGTVVHLACELDDLGTLDEAALDEEIMPYLAAYRKFKAEHQCIWRGIEEPRYDHTYRFAGTIDRYGMLDGRASIVDLKTGAKVPTFDIQLAGYALLLRYDSMSSWQRLILQLNSDGSYYLHQSLNTMRGDINVFLSSLAVYNWKKGRFNGR